MFPAEGGERDIVTKVKHRGKIYLWKAANSLKAQTFLLLECQSKEKEILNGGIALQVSNSRNLERTFVRGYAAFQEAGGVVNELKLSMCVMSSYVLLLAHDSVRFLKLSEQSDI